MGAKKIEFGIRKIYSLNEVDTLIEKFEAADELLASIQCGEKRVKKSEEDKAYKNRRDLLLQLVYQTKSEDQPNFDDLCKGPVQIQGKKYAAEIHRTGKRIYSIELFISRYDIF